MGGRVRSREVESYLLDKIPALICVVWLCRCRGVSSSIVSVCLEHCVASSLCLASFFLSVIKKPSKGRLFWNEMLVLCLVSRSRCQCVSVTCDNV